jgi:hypothetical protein
MIDLAREIGEKLGIDPISLVSLESFSGELEEDTFGGMIFFHRRLSE